MKLSRAQVRRVDQIAIDHFGIPGVILMENAGRGATHAILEHLDRPGRPRVAVFCGHGNNGGDGFVVARHLHNLSFPVEVMMMRDPDALTADARLNYDILERMKLPCHGFDMTAAKQLIAKSEVLIDALIGTGFSGTVRSPLNELIPELNAADHAMRVALDVPSGLDCDTGTALGPAVRADLTVTFCAPKIGFSQPTAPDYLGAVEVADIGAPKEALRMALAAESTS